jgi:predicted Zn-dependent peptidase
MQKASDRADRLSMFATYFGNPELVNEQVEQYRAVGIDDVNRLISRCLVPQNRATLLYVPGDGAAETAEAAA